MKKQIMVVAVTAALMGCMALVGCGGSSTSGADTGAASAGSAKQEQPAAPKYSVADEQLVDKGYGMYTISGTLTNNTGKTASYVQVEYVLKDADGAQIGTGLANTNNLTDGTPWKFEAFCSVSGDAAPASFELIEVTGF